MEQAGNKARPNRERAERATPIVVSPVVAT